MNFEFTNINLIIGLGLVVLVAGVAIAMYFKHRKTRTAALRNRFGSEYDRAVLEHGSPKKAEAKLSSRQTRVEALPLRDLSPTERDRFVTEWATVQSRFVDHPKSAVTEADDLINSLLLARGYPQSSFEQRAADVSVSYAQVMENYRLANAIAVRPGRADASTEELRTAMIQYRAIFDELVQVKEPGAARVAA